MAVTAPADDIFTYNIGVLQVVSVDVTGGERTDMRCTGREHGVLVVVLVREEGEGRVRLALLVVTPALDLGIPQHAGEAIAERKVVDVGGEV